MPNGLYLITSNIPWLITSQSSPRTIGRSGRSSGIPWPILDQAQKHMANNKAPRTRRDWDFGIAMAVVSRGQARLIFELKKTLQWRLFNISLLLYPLDIIYPSIRWQLLRDTSPHCMYVCMYGWMDGWMDGKMYACMHYMYISIYMYMVYSGDHYIHNT